MKTQLSIQTRCALWLRVLFSVCLNIITMQMLALIRFINPRIRSKKPAQNINATAFGILLDLMTVFKNLTDFMRYLRLLSKQIDYPISPNPGKFFRDLWNMLNIQDKERVALKFVAKDEFWQVNASGKHIKELKSFTAPLIAERKINTLILKRAPLSSINDFASAKVTTILTFHPDHLNDDEVIEALYLWVKKRGKENCLLRCSGELIIKDFKTIPSATTLISVGHGYLRETSSRTYYCGPYRGAHDDVVKLFAAMIQQCNHLNKVVLSHCYYGAPISSPLRSPTLFSQISFCSKHLPLSGRQKAMFLWKREQPKVIPFKKTSFAGMLWLNLYKSGRLNQGFELVASPQILNPYPFEHPCCFIGSDHDQYKPSAHYPPEFWEDHSETPKLENLKTIKLSAPRISS